MGAVDRERELTMATLELPMPPNMANSRMHWRAKDRKRREYYTHATTVLLLGLGVPKRPIVKARVRVTLYVWAMMDYDNMMARLKWPLDVLVKSGWLEDDGPDHLEFAEMPTQVVDRKNQRVAIELEAVA